VITLLRTPAAATTQDYSISFTRTTPQFPTSDRTDRRWYLATDFMRRSMQQVVR